MTPPQDRRVSALNPANVLTVLRIALVPPFFALLVLTDGTGWRLTALALFCVAAFTDYADGRIARSRKEITTFGKIVDPIADKLLTGAALVGLSINGELTWWATVIILAREIPITVHRLLLLRGDVVVAAEKLGKYKAAIQMLAIFVYLLPVRLDPLNGVLMTAAVVMTIVSGLEYLGARRRAALG
ncbi:CDP-diacylglycerol--glycerol-3-phosphate 3-phosphatidyltransferase [Actinocorallia sp. A-T 12471]|uniref:CDP-diacylglycerol--glycerol-3-phosphate 3-phosphatidyltransferase n=1 Tax=Actinocorallia sp. A-T 12471 TaxID=3089813 RepID=UPI0029D3A52A|nr:CDP-diacylglycerol--glycerol-3-phosphate 3-phosphatidyltransferase [Actinocorallia sp. A-T 12471]MDX6743435.1 CDP-diacylglycerol--glycerol-3-phosphate 3-phosphatidyltransferase [Actinocorallia sp. A-T 12471]